MGIKCCKDSKWCKSVLDDSRDVYVNALPAGACFIYVIGIFRILTTFKTCQKQENTTSLKEWIKVEACIFNIILFSTCLYCVIYKLTSVFNHRMFQLYNVDHKKLRDDDYLIATYWQATIFNNAWINCLGSYYVRDNIVDYLIEDHTTQTHEMLRVAAFLNLISAVFQIIVLLCIYCFPLSS